MGKYSNSQSSLSGNDSVPKRIDSSSFYDEQAAHELMHEQIVFDKGDSEYGSEYSSENEKQI